MGTTGLQSNLDSLFYAVVALGNTTCATMGHFARAKNYKKEDLLEVVKEILLEVVKEILLNTVYACGQVMSA